MSNEHERALERTRAAGVARDAGADARVDAEAAGAGASDDEMEG